MGVSKFTVEHHCSPAARLKTIGQFPMRLDGILKTWNDDRGFGFIMPDESGEQIFVHISAFSPGMGRPTAGIRVSFDVELAPNGKTRAKAVQFAIPGRSSLQSVAQPFSRLTGARVFAVACLLATVPFVNTRWSTLSYILAAYGIMSFLTFLSYGIDKSAAIGGRRRTPESELHLLGLFCGWPGALIAQHAFRHKISKPQFVTTFWVTVLLNLVALVAVLSSPEWSRLANPSVFLEEEVSQDRFAHNPFTQERGYLYIDLNERETRDAANLPTVSPHQFSIDPEIEF